MRANLNKIAALMALGDNAEARNEDVVSAKTALAQLGRLLRDSTAEEAAEIVHAITTRAGKRSK
jgi:hypothetical protein